MLLLSLVLAGTTVFYVLFRPTSSAIERDKITAAALAQAKAALIGYAAGVSISSGGRPGDLPCPDTNDSGSTGSSCGNAAGTTGQTTRIGRLPWKSLGLPDLRDGDGERLWYAVSSNFKYNIRTTCILPGQPGYISGAEAGCLNSDSRGTITVRNSAGTVINDGSNPDPFTPSAVIAVIFAPGATLQRQDGTLQNRDCSGGTGCAVTGVCNSTATAKCNPINYLDVLTSIPEDNADFVDGSNTNGFINGVIRDANNNVIVNDRLITITYNDLMPLLERRVAKEVLNCLNLYASTPANHGRHPWASRQNDLSFNDASDVRFGRIPDTLINTASNSTGMNNFWPAGCSHTQGNWWYNWKELVFYGVSNLHDPRDIPPMPCGSCLRVDPPSVTNDKAVVVVVAGTRLQGVNGGQPRGTTPEKSDSRNYLEGPNGTTSSNNTTFTQKKSSNTFNDILLFQ